MCTRKQAATAFACWLVATVPLSAVNQVVTEPVDADVVLQAGMLHLGDGNAPVAGSVAIRGERIVAVGQFAIGEVGKIIDCRGKVICPGFIDLHNHSDSPILAKETRACSNYVTQGCTTIVTGNCGAGPIDVAEYYDRIDDLGVGINVAHLLPQGNLRREVIGSEQRAASAAEQQQMNDIAEKAMRDGAWGMSTGLIYVPSSYADTNELVSLARVVSNYDGIYVSHIRNEGLALLEAVDEALEIGQEADLPVHVSHFKSSGKDAWGLVRVAVQKIQQARDSGRHVTADQYPYAASSTSLGATLFPAWAFAGGQAKLLQRLDDETQGKRIRDAIAKKLVILDSGQRLQIASYAPHPDWAGKRLAEIAKAENVSPLKLAIAMQRAGGASVVNHSMNEQDIRFVMTQAWVATASDGGAKIPNASVPHPRSYGTFPRKIGYYALREQALPLAQAIRSATGLPADILKINDRGYLRRDQFADVVVFDPEQVIDTATFDDPHRYSRGIDHVFLNGKPVVSHGTPTGILAGRSLRRGVVEPAAQDAGETDLSADQIERIDRLFARWDKVDSPGFSLGILRDGRFLYRQGYGTGNLDYQIPLDAESAFYMASVSKQFVAACVVLMSLEGKLSLDDDVRKYFPELPKYPSEITIRHLMHHTSGLPDYFALMQSAGMRFGDYYSHQQLIDLVARSNALEFPAGEKHKYCNTGYLLMADLIRRVSSQTLRQFSDAHIFRPLGMAATRFHDNHRDIIAKRVMSYARENDRFRLAYLAQWDKVGSGGLISSVDDLARWDENFYSMKVGGREWLELMVTPGKLNDGTTLKYAGGLMLDEHAGRPTIGHSGSFMGFRTALLRFPDEHFSIVLLSNLQRTVPMELAKQISDICLP